MVVAKDCISLIATRLMGVRAVTCEQRVVMSYGRKAKPEAIVVCIWAKMSSRL